MQTHEIIEKIVTYVADKYGEDWRKLRKHSDPAMIIHKSIAVSLKCSNAAVCKYFKPVGTQLNECIFKNKYNTNEKFRNTYQAITAIIHSQRIEKGKESNFFCEGLAEFDPIAIPRKEHRELLEYYRFKPTKA